MTMKKHQEIVSISSVIEKMLFYMRQHPERIGYLKDVIAECFDVSIEQFDADINERMLKPPPSKKPKKPEMTFSPSEIKERPMAPPSNTIQYHTPVFISNLKGKTGISSNSHKSTTKTC